ncbi:GntR family transcriptional regulator [Bifidobacterium eulemuris]|uniref:GntR family transcriptional regulator n=1 Tax=Bifidobacterium eulemuris TaxID=1765219 RepID=A0A261GA38_9BIFI|nr:GntR family transcriptional regulator [Bifidobacterium eulemuris]OZG68103.1 GntR family transcriptional regulator [Bifidobacterium eulemuris]QOL31830.1 GntR family transcriptional regulator [Bifidobacterium eulemuris]
MRFDDTSGEPLFKQVANQLNEAIVAGTYREGEQVPSTTEISAAYRINPATVLKGMNLLVDQGLLEKRRGLGMFVATGAREKARTAMREEFLTKRVTQLVAEAKRLGIGPGELSELIEKGYRQS